MKRTHYRLIPLGLLLASHLLSYHAIASEVVKSQSNPAVYYIYNGKRYAFPNEKVYFSWYSDFSHVSTITDSQLAAIPLAANVTYRPGVRMVKIATDPKVYAVASNGTLRWIPSEMLAKTYYGALWNKNVHDVSDAFFVNYQLGSPIAQVADYNPVGQINLNPVFVPPELSMPVTVAPPAAPTPNPVLTPQPDLEPIPSPAPVSAIPAPTPVPPLDPRFTEVKAKIEAILVANNVPGVSVAFVAGDKILWANGIGTMEAGSGKPVTVDTLFQAASISKPLAAMAALRLVEQGKLSLNAVLDSYLKTVKIPGSDIMTLRQVLSHSAGLNIHGFLGYKVGASLPTTQQILLGQSPANTPAIKVVSTPGTYVYSGGGYVLLQQLLMDTTGKAFPQLMSELILSPLGMTHSAYEQPLSSGFASLASSGHSSTSKVLSGKGMVYPELAAAGLWTTPSDLAKLVIAVQQMNAGKSGGLLTKATVTDMLTLQSPGGIGLGWFVQGDTKSGVFFHGGVNSGFKSSVGATMLPNNALIIMTNSDNGNAVLGPIKDVITAAWLKK